MGRMYEMKMCEVNVFCCCCHSIFCKDYEYYAKLLCLLHISVWLCKFFFHMTITFKNTSFKAHKTNEEIKMQLWKFEYHYPCTLKIRDEIIRKNIWHFELNVVVRIPPLFLPGNNSFHENEFWNLASDILSLKPTGKSLVFPSLSYSSNSSGSAKYMLLSGNLWDVDLCF